MRAVVVIDESNDEEEAMMVYPSVSAAARALGKDDSTVHRALTGDRNKVTAGECLIMDLELAGNQMLIAE